MAVLGSLSLLGEAPGFGQASSKPAGKQQTKKAGKPAKVPTEIKWQHDFVKAFKQAKKSNGLLMVDFYSDT